MISRSFVTKIPAYIFCRTDVYMRCQCYQQKRFKSKYKKKWAKMEGSKQYTDIALDHFDLFYKPVFKGLWPSIRIGLLTSPKYCALLNNYHGNSSEVEDFLLELGSQECMYPAFEAKQQLNGKVFSNEALQNTSPKMLENLPPRPKDKESSEDELELFNESSDFKSPNLEPLTEKNTSLYDFVPTDKVYSDKDLLLQEEVDRSTYQRDNFTVPVNVIPGDVIQLPEKLKFFVFEKGNVSYFPKPRTKRDEKIVSITTEGSTSSLDTSKFKRSYYMMDAGSLLPVLALDLKPTDKVLDLCSAPGGKVLSALMTKLTDDIHCNDTSISRIQRLQNTLQWYTDPDDIQNLTTSNKDGRLFDDPIYDKVLVDVPCNTDRHVLTVNDNNLFQPKRIRERLEITTLQKDLLVAGIQSCKPGGTVVYSTCTLSPAQNDGTVQAAFEHIWKETNIDICVANTRYITKLFNHVMKFYKGCRYGQLVIPSLSANFGPMYICKIKRLN